MTTFNKNSFRKPVHSKSYGIEVETCMHPDDKFRLFNKPKRIEGFFRFAVDGSIDAQRVDGIWWTDVEIVSQPLPYKMLRKQLDKLKKYRYVTNTTCGIHVHVSKKAVSYTRIGDLLRCLRSINHEQYYDLFGRYPNMYNNPQINSRYCSINALNEHTIEFRMFASGDVAWAKECLRRTKLMVEYKGKYSYENLLDLFTKPEK